MSQTVELTPEQIAAGMEFKELDLGTQATGPLRPRSIYERMIAIIEELPAIGKTQQNKEQGFMFRGHDQVMNALNPLLAKYGVFIVPNVIERVVSTRETKRGTAMYEVNLHVEFTFYGAAGDSFTASGWGEGTDMGDKATNKAMTGAFKYVVAQAFALATAETSDADATSPEETMRGATGPTHPSRQGGVRVDNRAKFVDPGKSLLPQAIAVKNADDATALEQAQRDLDPSQDWAAITDFLAVSLFDHKQAEFSAAEWGEWWKRLANAVVKVTDLAGGDFPPPTPEQITEGYAWAFNGITLALSERVEPVEDAEDGVAQADAALAEEAAQAAAADTAGEE